MPVLDRRKESTMSPTHALTDLYQRLVDAEASLRSEARKATSEREELRLIGKAQGVSLARDYVRHT